MPEWLGFLLVLLAIVIAKTLAMHAVARGLRTGRLSIRAATHLGAAAAWVPYTVLGIWSFGLSVVMIGIAALMVVVTTLTMRLFRPFLEDIAVVPDAS